jgi:hypothetical protein
MPFLQPFVSVRLLHTALQTLFQVRQSALEFGCRLLDRLLDFR